MKRFLFRTSCFLLLFVSISTLQAQDTVRVMSYNLLRYGAVGIGCTPTGVSARNTWLTDILARAKPDLFGVNEIGPIDNAVAPHVNITQNILPNINYGNYEATQIRYESHQDICNMMWYNADKFGLVKQGLINVTGTRRDLDFYQFYYKSPGTITDSTYLYVVLVHLMAGSATDRSDQTNAIMNHLATRVGGQPNVIVMGDMNMDSYNALAFQNMVNYSDTDLRMRDPLSLTGTWSNNTSAQHSWTQSTPGNAPCGAGNNLDDRFDVMVCTNALMNGTQGMSYLNGSYYVMGNPFAPNQSVPTSISGALAAMSDHYPVMLDLEIDQSVSREPEVRVNLSLNVVSPVSNAIKGRVDIPAGHAGEFQIELIDVQGRILLSQNEYWETGVHALDIAVPNPIPGIHFLRISQPGTVPTVKKIVVFGDFQN